VLRNLLTVSASGAHHVALMATPANGRRQARFGNEERAAARRSRRQLTQIAEALVSVQPAEQPDQQDDGDWNPDQPKQQSASHVTSPSIKPGCERDQTCKVPPSRRLLSLARSIACMTWTMEQACPSAPRLRRTASRRRRPLPRQGKELLISRPRRVAAGRAGPANQVPGTKHRAAHLRDVTNLKRRIP
jgi:hypothetical protein